MIDHSGAILKASTGVITPVRGNTLNAGISLFFARLRAGIIIDMSQPNSQNSTVSHDSER